MVWMLLWYSCNKHSLQSQRQLNSTSLTDSIQVVVWTNSEPPPPVSFLDDCLLIEKIHIPPFSCQIIPNTNWTNLRQRRIVLLSVLTPPLRRNVFIRRNRPPLLLCTDFENHRWHDGNGHICDCSVAFPCHRGGPPTSWWGPDLIISELCE